MKVLLATHNPGKIQSYKEILEERGIASCTLKELGIAEHYEETFSTFEQTARAKALFYFRLSGLPCLTDDGGFEIDYFNQEPGVKSRRWLGYQATDQEIVEHLKKIVPTIPADNRTARFVAVTCLVKDEEHVYCSRKIIEGRLTEDVRNNYPSGFPYRAAFIESTYNRHVQDLTDEELKTVSHRRQSVAELIKYLC